MTLFGVFQSLIDILITVINIGIISIIIFLVHKFYKKYLK